MPDTYKVSIFVHYLREADMIGFVDAENREEAYEKFKKTRSVPRQHGLLIEKVDKDTPRFNKWI